jgi:hypothetical protein
VSATDVVVVFEDIDELFTFEPLRQLRLPLRTTTGIRCRNEPESGDIVRVLLTLANPDRFGR